jgi:hypothetical protein
MSEIERDMRTECYSCRHRRSVLGNTHIQCAKPDPAMEGNPHGVRHGWFFYPLLFDPVWKQRLCANHEPREET